MQLTKVSPQRSARGEMRVRNPHLASPNHVTSGIGAVENSTLLRAQRNSNTVRGSGASLGAVYEAQEAAARRIAHRLHDESAQILAAIYLGLADIARDCPDSTTRKIDMLVTQLDEVREQLRGLSHELSPPLLEQFGLVPALQTLAKGFSKRSKLIIVVSGKVNMLSRAVDIVLYRVVQEALSNVVRHAKASKVDVRLSIKNKHVTCTVVDDGVGFKTLPKNQSPVVGMINGPVNGGLGLPGIYERVTALNGSCRISSSRNGGLKLLVEIPL